MYLSGQKQKSLSFIAMSAFTLKADVGAKQPKSNPQQAV
jgi:hypothetical protein